MKIYLAHPVDAADPSVAADALEVRRALLDYAHAQDESLVVYNPPGAFSVNYTSQQTIAGEDGRWLIDLNEMALHTSNIAVLLYYHGTESWGLPQELLMCERWEKPVLVLIRRASPEGRLPLYLSNRVPRQRVFEDLTLLAGELFDLMENKQWKSQPKKSSIN